MNASLCTPEDDSSAALRNTILSCLKELEADLIAM